MKKIIVLALTFVLAATALTGCSKSGASNSQDKSSGYLKSGEISFAVDDTFPPMEYRDQKNNNKLVGFEIDMGEEVGKRLGVKVKWVPTAWDGIMMGLKAKKYDAILSTLCITDARKKEIDFSKPYFKLDEIIAVKSGNTSIKSANDLKGKVVGCQIGAANQATLEKMGGLKEIKTYNKITDAYTDLKNGRLDAVVTEGPIAAYYKKNDASFDAILDKPIASQNVGIAYTKGNTALNNKVQKVLDKMKADGTFSKLSIRWFGTDLYK
ncbi:substrate-binding periplasmic protein [Clostridium guangxiense]|uniref:substrate-binding periplasmic protein n=1 Tax=Clostridium guangxiense TaxID=1662055 RepID=UPI001E3BB0E9|nr:ABC transporter substrate-binding protein [Clostridium guangxiense]MCD2348029.1 ABC transporter substrate-binding protein [Clostridium guangxiense]